MPYLIAPKVYTRNYLLLSLNEMIKVTSAYKRKKFAFKHYAVAVNEVNITQPRQVTTLRGSVIAILPPGFYYNVHVEYTV